MRSRAGAIVAALAVTETVSWGIVPYAFAVFLIPMQEALDASTPALTGAFSLALLVSGAAGVAVGRALDSRSPRALMTCGSLAGALLVLAWSRVDSLVALYAVWAGLGVVMATVLYEPAFTVLAKWFPDPPARRRAMTAMTLAGATASTIFLPLAQWLIEARGWRDALVVLASMLALVTVPLHALVLRPAPVRAAASRAAQAPARDVLRSRSFQLLTAAFFLASFTAFGFTVQSIGFLLDRGYGAGFAAAAVGLVGFSQIPGRVLFAAAAGRLSGAAETAGVIALVAAGLGTVAAAPSTPLLLGGFVLLGMGNGMATLARAGAIADRYGPERFGTINGVAGAVSTVARAAGPFAAALLAVTVGFTAMAWLLAVLAAAGALLACTSPAAPVSPSQSWSATVPRPPLRPERPHPVTDHQANGAGVAGSA